MCLKKHPHSLKRSVHLQQSALSFFCFVFCIVFLSVLSWLLLLTFSLSLSAIILSNIHAFFSSQWQKYPHSCPLFSCLSIYRFVLFPLALSLSFTVSLAGSTPSLTHPLSLSPLLRLLARLQCLTVTRLLFHLFSLFSPHFSLCCVSVNMWHCSEWPYRSWAVHGENSFILVSQSWRI